MQAASEHMSLDRRKESWNERYIPPREMPGVSAGAMAAFCDAIEFAIHGEPPTHGELGALRAALRRIAREAQATGVAVEKMLLGLKAVWTDVCGREPKPDMHDPAWHVVTRESVHAYFADS